MLFCFWTVVIYGIFIYHNLITSPKNLYNIPQTNNWFDLHGYFEQFIWLLTIIKEFFLIGFKFLFTGTPPGDWEMFLTFNKFIFVSVIFINLINTKLNTGKIK